ncbi:hypothetical protein Peur_038393 [Populus x canadensis]
MYARQAHGEDCDLLWWAYQPPNLMESIHKNRSIHSCFLLLAVKIQQKARK